jgi:hypothetical protein
VRTSEDKSAQKRLVLVYDPKEVPAVMTVRPRVARVL